MKYFWVDILPFVLIYIFPIVQTVVVLKIKVKYSEFVLPFMFGVITALNYKFSFMRYFNIDGLEFKGAATASIILSVFLKHTAGTLRKIIFVPYVIATCIVEMCPAILLMAIFGLWMRDLVTSH